MTEKLSIEDLPKLVKVYKYASSEWYDVGVQLGIPISDLKIIERDYPNQCRRCFSEMIEVWLRNKESCFESDLKLACGSHAVAAKDMVSDFNLFKFIISLAVIVALCSICVGILVNINTRPGPIETAAEWQPADGPIENSAEILKLNYKSLKVTSFGLGGMKSVEYLGTYMKDKNGREFEYTEFLRNYTGEGGRVILTGLPGSGKTTLLKHMAREWANGRALQSCKIVFLVDLYQIREEIHNIFDLLSNSSVANLNNLKDIVHAIFATQGAGACFLLDDYNPSKLQYIEKIMIGEEVQSSFCLLASRSDLTRLVKLPKFEIIGYNIDNLPYYLDKLTENAAVKSRVAKMWDDKSRNFKEQCASPLLMAMTVYIFQNDTSFSQSIGPITDTQLYLAFVNAIIRHFKEDENKHHWPKSFLWQCIRNSVQRKDDSLCAAFKVLTYVAFNIEFKSEYSFPSEGDDLEESINKLGFVSVSNVHGEVEYRFFHKTFVEFFAALHIATLPLNEQLLRMSQLFPTLNVYKDDSYHRYQYSHGPFNSHHYKVQSFYIGLVCELNEHNVSATAQLLRKMVLGFRLFKAERLIEDTSQPQFYTMLDKNVDAQICNTMIDVEYFSEYVSKLTSICKWFIRREISLRKIIESAFVINSALYVHYGPTSYIDKPNLDKAPWPVTDLKHYLGNWKTYVVHKMICNTSTVDSDYAVANLFSKYYETVCLNGVCSQVLALKIVWIEYVDAVKVLSWLAGGSDACKCRDINGYSITNDLQYIHIRNFCSRSHKNTSPSDLMQYYITKLKNILSVTVPTVLNLHVNYCYLYYRQYHQYACKDSVMLEMEKLNAITRHSITLHLVLWTSNYTLNAECISKPDELLELCEYDALQHLEISIDVTKEAEAAMFTTCLSEAQNLLKLEIEFRNFDCDSEHHDIQLLEKIPHEVELRYLDIGLRHCNKSKYIAVISNNELEAISNKLRTVCCPFVLGFHFRIPHEKLNTIINVLLKSRLRKLTLFIEATANQNQIDLDSFRKLANLEYLMIEIRGEKNNVIQHVAMPLIRSLKDLLKMKLFDLTLYIRSPAQYTSDDEKELAKAYDMTHIQFINIRMSTFKDTDWKI